MKLKPAVLVVFEGLDKAGKSTALKNIMEQMDDPVSLHMPSEPTDISFDLYNFLEDAADMEPLARQYVHLACHAQNMPHIHEAWARTGLFLDRWWWSTIAYGFYGGELDKRIPIVNFMHAVSLVWTGTRADVIYMFRETYEDDAWNNERVVEGYQQLSTVSDNSVVFVPRGTEEEVRDFIINDLKERDLVLA